MARSFGAQKRKKLVTLVVLVLTFALYFGEGHGWLKNASASVQANQPGLYQVDHYDDGDTIAVKMNGKVETLRFIGVDTPETHDPRKPVQCYGPAAAAYTKNLISRAGSKVRLQSDPLSTNRDRYNRLLRYIYLPDGTFVNEALVKNGYAFYYPYFPFTKSTQFNTDQKTAQAAKKGLWGNCNPTPTDAGGYTSNPISS